MATDQDRVTVQMRFSHQLIEPNPVIEAFKGDIDRTLIRQNLQLPYEERLRKLMALQQFARELS
jgi:hypothetical protein